MKLSAIITTKNEEDSIARCLKSLRFSDEILVVDSGSTDRTVEIAKQHGARVFHHPWAGYGPQKNFGVEQASGQWLLFVDADEEVPTALAQEIQSVVGPQPALYPLQPTSDFYWLRIVTVFLNKPLQHLTGHNPRLFRKSAGRWTDDRVHEQAQTIGGQRIRLGDDKSKTLQHPLLHYSHPTIASYLQKMHHYTALDAEQMRKTGKLRSGYPIPSLVALPVRLFWKQLLKLLFYRKGILDGYAGIVWSFLSAYYEWEMARKYLYLAKKNKFSISNF